MVQAEIIEIYVIVFPAHVLFRTHKGRNGTVAQAHHGNIRIPSHSLRDNSGWIGKIDQLGARSVFFHHFSDFQDHRDGTQRFGEAAGAGGFLADIAVAQADSLVLGSGGQQTHTELSYDIIRAFYRGLQVIGHYHFRRIVIMLAHSLDQAAYNFQPVHTDIHQGKFLYLHFVLTVKKSVDQFRAVGASRADHANLQLFHKRTSPNL